MTGTGPAACLALAALLLLSAAPPRSGLEAQSTSTGALAGTVRAADGEPLDGVEVTLRDGTGGSERVVTASRDGSFRFPFLAPGGYELVLERIGFIPLVVQDVEIRPGMTARLEGSLRSASPPITEVDRVPFALLGSMSGETTGEGLTRAELEGLPQSGFPLVDILPTLSTAGSRFSMGGASGYGPSALVDGIPFRGASNPHLGPGHLHLLSFPTWFAQEVQHPRGVPDAEWRGGPLPSLHLTSVRGTSVFQVEARGGLVTGPFTSADPGMASADALQGPEVGVLLRGPIRRDTLHFAAGVELRRLLRARPAVAAGEAEALVRFRESIPDHPWAPGDLDLPTPTGEWDVISGFGRLDWRPAEGHDLALQGRIGLLRDGPWDTSDPVLPSARLEASDAAVALTSMSRLGESAAIEVRVGLENARREFALGGIGNEVIGRVLVTEPGLVVGGDPQALGTFEQTSFYFSPNFQLEAGDHSLRGGIQGVVELHSVATPTPGGTHLMPTIQNSSDLRGAYLRWEGARPEREFRAGWSAFYVRDRWTPAPNLAITAGMRMEFQSLPEDEVVGSAGWGLLTGLSHEMEQPEPRFSPRLHTEWRPSAGSPWLVRAGAGVELGRVDPGLLGEIVADTGFVRAVRGMGPLGEWATGSGPETAEYRGTRLSLIGPGFSPPRVRSLTVGLSRALVPGVELEARLEHRATDYLPRVRDLNRVPLRYGVDQLGREIFGEVLLDETHLTIRPGSDRRFQGFDVVSALESDGSSTWSGATAALQFTDGRGASLYASYTYSVAEDDTPLTPWGRPAFLHGRPSSSGDDPEWLQGRSDLDQPHHLLLRGRFRSDGRLGWSLGATYSLRSGPPFTPSARDALGFEAFESWSAPAPIRVPPELESEVSALLARSNCAGIDPDGRFERNACRMGALHDLDLRFALELGAGVRWRLLATVDALNLLDARHTIPDPALFIVDGTGTLLEEPPELLVLPLAVNPSFGEPLVGLRPGRMLRVGLSLRY